MRYRGMKQIIRDDFFALNPTMDSKVLIAHLSEKHYMNIGTVKDYLLDITERYRKCSICGKMELISKDVQKFVCQQCKDELKLKEPSKYRKRNRQDKSDEEFFTFDWKNHIMYY